jgi:hypothetical protein
MKDNFKLRGEVVFTLTDELGNVKQTEKANMIMNVGKAFITDRMVGTASAVMSHIGVGTGVTAAANTQTTLITEIGTRATVTATRTTSAVTNDAVQYVATFAAGNATGALTEAGIFNASTVGTMLARTVFSAINKGANDTLTITWTVVVA